MDPIEAVAVVMTLVGIVLTIKEKIACWPVATGSDNSHRLEDWVCHPKVKKFAS